MKKFFGAFFLMFVAAVLMVSCNNTAEDSAETGESGQTEEIPTTAEEDVSSESEIPPATEEKEGEEETTPSEEAEPTVVAEMSFSSLQELENMFAWKDFGQGIKYLDVKIGDGGKVKVGDMIFAHYTLWTAEGEMLQTSKGNTPFRTNVGVGNLIPGWDLTVPGMTEGSIRRLIVPGEMAYGAQGRPDAGIAPNATLVFELEIVRIVK